MQMPTVYLKPREEIRIRAGHPWIYDNEIARVAGSPEPGQEVAVLDASQAMVGCGFFSPASKIRVRIYSRAKARVPADKAFFVEAFASASAYRSRVLDPGTSCFRLAYGEADSLPGLIVDSFSGVSDSGPGRWLSVQFLGMGVERKKSLIVDALEESFSPNGIIERSDAPVRSMEGLEPSSALLRGEVPGSITIEENGCVFSIDLSAGQKTGWYLDQRDNRAAAARYARGSRVLDAFCNQGGFGINCLKGGASSVLALDSSPEALAAAALNARLNGFSERHSILEANAFDALRDLERTQVKFDLVILDPPAFAKSKQSVEPARRGYREINLRGMRLLKRGGILVTCSCSHWFDNTRFDAVLEEAAADCGRRFRILEERTQAKDHPIISGYAESRYLKCRILEML